jgi:glutamate synthase domain-containing protein 3
MSRPASPGPVPTISVPEIRDYERINTELVGFLDEGHPHVRLVGAEGQRLLASRIRGAWNALVEVQGRAGPELAAELNAPGLTIVCSEDAADGAGRALRAGRLVILGDAGDAVGYTQEGGTIVVARSAGARAGLGQGGGVLAVFGAAGRLAGERQSGGRLFVYEAALGPHPGRGQRGGRLIRLPTGDDPLAGVDPDDAAIFRGLLQELRTWGSTMGIQSS